MEQKIEVKPFIPTQGDKCMIMQITDITLHTDSKRPTIAIGQKIVDVFRENQPGRIYTPMGQSAERDKQAIVLAKLQNDPVFLKAVKGYQEQGYKVLFGFPKNGIPILAGKDTVEFIKSTKGQRILRRIDKGKSIGKI
jgi:hypothetical protein